MKRLITLIFILIFIFLAQSKIINVPGEISSLAEAVSFASVNDTILIAPGTYTQFKPLNINKSITIASNFIHSKNQSDVFNTIINAVSDELEEWIELSAENSKIIGITFLGNAEHTLNITASFAAVQYCRFIGGNDQLSITEGGGYIGYCYFENAGDDGIDCDESLSWTIEYNTIVNAHQDGIEIRLHDKMAPLTKHIFRYNTVISSGESGIQLIDYQGNSFREFYIHHNIFENCSGSGVSCMYQEKDNTSEVYKGSLMEEKTFVYNNTFIGCNYGLTLAPSLIILNNIFSNLKTRGIERGAYINDNNDFSMVDYCLFYNIPEFFDGEVHLGKKNILNQNPLLGENWSLKSGSPCLDAGVTTYLWNQISFEMPSGDYIGIAPDLGALEKGGNRWKVDLFSVIDAGEDLVILAPSNQAKLTGIQKRSGLETRESFQVKWSKISGPGKVVFSDETSSGTTAIFSKQGTYELLLSGDNQNQVSDRLRVNYVKGYSNQMVQVDDGEKVFIEAEDFRYLVGTAEIVSHKESNNKVVISKKNEGTWAYTEYQISTQSTGRYFVWVCATGNSSTENDVFVAFKDLSDEIKVSGTTDGKFSYNSWKRVAFSGIPEGIYNLRIRAAEDGVMWDKICITMDENQHPLN